MQRATAEPAPRCPGGGRKVAVEDEQLLMEVGEMAKIGRNDLCHCKSGKKYKKYCMASDEAAARPAQPAAVPALFGQLCQGTR
jgi:hypothetical protein